jgi:hypothetical protein
MPPRPQSQVKHTEHVSGADGKPVPNNGHVCYNAAEAKALTELLSHEKRYADKFKLDMSKMTRQRNPILGEPTPREGKRILHLLYEKSHDLRLRLPRRIFNIKRIMCVSKHVC